MAESLDGPSETRWTDRDHQVQARTWRAWPWKTGGTGETLGGDTHDARRVRADTQEERAAIAGASSLEFRCSGTGADLIPRIEGGVETDGDTKRESVEYC